MKMKKRFLSILLSLVMVLGLMPGMSLTAYAEGTVHTALQQGDVIKLGDSINITTGNHSKFGYCLTYNGSFAYTLAINNMPWTLVRGDLGFDNSSYVEKSNGNYYLFKGADGTMMPYKTDSLIKVTNASDGIYYQSDFYGYPVAAIHIPPHNHDFTYSADGATITATCTADGCTLPESSAGAGNHVATLTISANGGTYDGTTAYGATITDANSIQGDAKVQYQKKTDGSYGTATETAPTDAGEYKASITVGGATASVEYTIAQADPTATAPTALTATYGQTLANVSLEGKNPEGNTPGTWAWADSTKSVGNVVTPAATFKANFTPTSSNYKTVENVDVTVTVSKAANPATVTGTATVIKGGNTVDLKDNVTKNGATGNVGYAIDGETKGCTLNGSVLTSGDTTGTVTVNVTVAADDNYNALAATPITVTISDKGTQTITAENVTATYGDTDKKVTASVTDPAQGGGAVSYAVKDGSGDYIDVNATTGALTIKKVPADGKAYVVVTAAGTAAYEQATKEVTVTINKANAVPATVTANNRTYDGTEKPLVTVTGQASGGEMQYALGTATEATQPYTTSIPTATNAGTYYVWYKVVGDKNHNDTAAKPVKVTIAKPEEKPTTTEEKTDAVVTTAPKAKTLTYNGKAKTLIAAGKATGGTLQYALGTKDKATGKYSTSIPTGTKAGTYYVWYMVKGDASHTDSKAACVKVTIAKANQKSSAPVITKITGNSITVKTEPGMEYSINGKTWQKGGTFSKLALGKKYTVRARVAGSANYKASKAASTKVKTLNANALLNAGFKVKQSKGKMTLSWTKVPGATSYQVFVQYCGKQGLPTKATATVKGTSVTLSKLNGAKLNQAKNFKLKVVALKGKTVLGQSRVNHIAGLNLKGYTNVKSLKVNKTALTLKVGKTARIKASVTLEKSKAKLLPVAHTARYRYGSSDKRVATVDANGKITAKSAGTCIVYVSAQNGLTKAVKVTVK